MHKQYQRHQATLAKGTYTNSDVHENGSMEDGSMFGLTSQDPRDLSGVYW